MYVGDNPNTFFPLRCPPQQGQNRVWRHTSLASLPAGTTADIGTDLVGWEWDARAQNGAEPAGVTTVAGSSVTGGLIQGNGAFTTQGNATATATIYRASSGAYVFSTGTNHWWRGLAKNQHGQGDPRRAHPAGHRERPERHGRHAHHAGREHPAGQRRRPGGARHGAPRTAPRRRRRTSRSW